MLIPIIYEDIDNTECLEDIVKYCHDDYKTRELKYIMPIEGYDLNYHYYVWLYRYNIVLYK